jgi:hypothetical protein
MAFSCGARSAFKLKGKRLLEKHAMRRQLQSFVGLPIERTIQLKIFGFQSRVFGYASQQLRANLIFIMKGEDHIRPTGTGEDL